MIKKIYTHTIHIAILIIALSSCEQEDINEISNKAQAITFGVPTLSVETSTRSNAKNELTEGDEFGVMGYCVPYIIGTQTFDYNSAASFWVLKKSYCSPEVFYKQKVVVTANGCTYDYTGQNENNPKYWYRKDYDTSNQYNSSVTEADEYKYSFFAYYPYASQSTAYTPWEIDAPTDKNTAGAPKLTFTMPQNGEEEETILDHTQTPDAMLAVLYDRTSQDGNLRFNFSHVLTGLGFEVNNFSNFDLIIHSIELIGTFHKKVSVDFTGTNTSWSFPDPKYTGKYIITNKDIELPAPNAEQNETVTSSESPIGGEHILLIAGSDTSFGTNIRIAINYTFNGENKTDENVTRPSTFTPRPGVKYTAQLNFVGNAFVLQFIADNGEEWEDGGSDNDDVIFE